MNKSDIFEEVGTILNEWAICVKDARGTAIADVTIDTIESISKCLGLPGAFTGYINEYRTREGALQSIVDYRDHFIHPFHVFCLGFVILKKWKKNREGRNMLKLIDRDKNALLKKWFVASIYHDVGYPSEKLELLVKEFFKTGVGRDIKSQFDWSSVLLANETVEHIHELSELFNQKDSDKYRIFLFTLDDENKVVEFLKKNYSVNNATHLTVKEGPNIKKVTFGNNSFSFELNNDKTNAILTINNNKCDEFIVKKENNSFKICYKVNFKKWLYKSVVEDHDHGVLTALMLLNKCKINWQDNDMNIAKEAALAIAIHNWRRDSNNAEIDIGPIQMEKFPLAFFLSYCDTAQEWGRKVLLELWKEKSTQAKMPEIPMFDSKLENVVVNKDTTTVTIKYESEFDKIISGNRTLQEVFEDVGTKFTATWSRNRASLNPIVAGIDKNDVPRGGFGIAVRP